MSDYQPSPHGLPGFAAPVEQVYSALTPFIELADGRTVVATDGADWIEPGADGLSLRVRWTRWAVAGTPAGKLQDVGLTSDVYWHIDNGKLIREETLSSKQPVSIKRWRLSVPTTHDHAETDLTGVRFTSTQGSLEVRMSDANFPVKISLMATGNSALGRGVHGAIPLHLLFEAKDITVNGSGLKYTIALTPRN
jgi:hypothetical protein